MRVPARHALLCFAAGRHAATGAAQALGGGGGSPARQDQPWDAPSVVQPVGASGPYGQPAGAASLAAPAGLGLQPQAQGPLVIGGIEFSREDDIENMEKLSNLFGQVFYTMILTPGDASIAETWRGLSTDVWALADHAAHAPALALPVAMCLYNYFWWEGAQSLQPNVLAGWRAAQLMYIAVSHARCNDPQLPAMHYFIQQCHLRWRYLLMLASEVGRHLITDRRDVGSARTVLASLRAYFDELRRLPNSGLLHGATPHEVNFNADYYPAAVARQGPVWRNPLQDVPIASFLEAHYPTIRGELDAILASAGTFNALDSQTRNAETQFGPRGDDWLTAYMFRKGEAIPSVCQHAPRTCELLASRPEIAKCRMGGSGAGFLRMRPGGRLKPHFGNAPRLSVHLGLIVPDGEIRMSVGYESVRWAEGKVIVFDDTYIHQVVHNGIEPRYVMNVWMCHPCDPQDGKAPGEEVPAYCEGPPGPIHQLGLQVLPQQQ